MSIQLICFQAFVLSFLGSVPPGAINLSLLEQSRFASAKRLLQWVLMAVVFEGLHLWLAFRIHFSLIDWFENALWIRLASALLLIVLGIVAWKRASNRAAVQHQKEFRQFILINMFNFSAIPFWLGVLQGIHPPESQQWAFALSALLGGGLCLGLFAFAGSIISHRLFAHSPLFPRMISLAFFGLAGVQLFPLFQQFTHFIL